ncbi:unnamed protein product [Sphenostylis stenocarpa]|uniref:Uncharacterized protein n=1 Tax=Sphenostylis stenocarpa TaxID=92480 RepID=A0AA86SJ95_9FABA|nr:unnamed protein product [Sphenostylis stenocarpa]
MHSGRLRTSRMGTGTVTVFIKVPESNDTCYILCSCGQIWTSDNRQIRTGIVYFLSCYDGSCVSFLK